MGARAYEVNFDGIVGLTHCYAGLSQGNLASTHFEGAIAHPKSAALQSLKKMKYLIDRGFKQGILPPHIRPDIATLRKLGYTGKDETILKEVYKKEPLILKAVCSASAMWTANAATISPSADTRDKRIHITTANLRNKFHRSLEAQRTHMVLKGIFSDEKYFCQHAPLTLNQGYSDEGAANHMRFCQHYGEPGLEFFIFGKYSKQKGKIPHKFPARQTFEASKKISQQHKLEKSAIVFAQQNPKLIDAGVFHNDVISVSDRNFLLYHEEAFLESDRVIEELKKKFAKHCHGELKTFKICRKELSVEDAIKSYLFNSQLLHNGSNQILLIAPNECYEMDCTRILIEQMIADPNNPIIEVKYHSLRESMQNGGGPACLRLRIVLTEEEIAHAHPGFFLNTSRYEELTAWVEKHYREELQVKDLLDPQLIKESEAAMKHLGELLEVDWMLAPKLN